MKKLRFTAAALALALLLSLAGCGDGDYPDRDLDGKAWDHDWAMLGSVLGVEDLTEQGFSLEANPVVLTGSDTFYAVWDCGEGQPYTNADGDDATIYDAVFYALLYGCGSSSDARAAIDEWLAREQEVYDITGTDTLTVNGLGFTVLYYGVKSEDNPYHHGAVAFALYENYAFNAELTCAEGIFSGSETAACLQELLSRCHFSADYSAAG